MGERHVVLRHLDVTQPHPFLRLWERWGLGEGGGEWVHAPPPPRLGWDRQPTAHAREHVRRWRRPPHPPPPALDPHAPLPLLATRDARWSDHDRPAHPGHPEGIVHAPESADHDHDSSPIPTTPVPPRAHVHRGPASRGGCRRRTHPAPRRPRAPRHRRRRGHRPLRPPRRRPSSPRREESSRVGVTRHTRRRTRVARRRTRTPAVPFTSSFSSSATASIRRGGTPRVERRVRRGPAGFRRGRRLVSRRRVAIRARFEGRRVEKTKVVVVARERGCARGGGGGGVGGGGARRR